MILQITLGDVIGWIITIASFGIAVTINVNYNRNGNVIKITKSKSKNVTGGNRKDVH